MARKVYTKLVPRQLNNDREYRIQVYQDIIDYLQTELYLLCWVITGGKTWIFVYHPETLRQSIQWKSPASQRLKKANHLNVKSQSHVDPFLRWEGHRQSASLQGDHTMHASFSVREVMRVVAGQIVTPLRTTIHPLRTPSASAIPGPEEDHRTRTMSLFT